MIASGSQCRYTEHFELLFETVNENFCPTSCMLVKMLCRHGPLTLKEAADAVRSERFSTTTSTIASGSAASPSTGGGQPLAGAGGSLSGNGVETTKAAQLLEDIFAQGKSAANGSLVREALAVAAGSGAQAPPQPPKEATLLLVSDTEIRKAAILLVQHGILEYSEVEKTYRARLGHGLLHCVLFPALLRHVKQLHGVAGEKLVELLHLYGVLPLNALLTLATQQAPLLHSAFASALAELRATSYITPITESGSDGDVSAASAAKRLRGEPSTPALGPSVVSPLHRSVSAPGGFASASSIMSLTAPCAVNYIIILHRLRQEAIVRLVQSRIVDDTAVKISSAMFALDTASLLQRGNVAAGSDRADGFPYRAAVSKSVSLPQLRASCDGLPVAEDKLLAVLSKLGMPGPPRDGGPGNQMLMRATSGTVADYRISYDRAAEILREEHCEQCVFSRHGILGVRIVKRLLAVHMLDDRHIAEQCIATLTQTREVLCALMRDGIVRQQEVPLVTSIERPPKLSQFLWTIEREQLEKVVSLQLVKSLRHARLRLAYESSNNANKKRPGVDEGGDLEQHPQPLSGKGALSQKHRAQPLPVDVAERALQSSILALVNAVLVMDYF